MTRAMPEVNLKELLYDNCENAHWDEVASRCLKEA